jgi:hypothetical protein
MLSAMASTQAFVFRIAALAVGACSVLHAQMTVFQKLPAPRNSHTPSCIDCVRDLGKGIPPKLAPALAFRSKHPCPTTGAVRGACPGYVIVDNKSNLRWRTLAQAAKDRARLTK